MKHCPLYNQHKFTVECNTKPCFSHCHHNQLNTNTNTNHENETLPIQKPDSDSSCGQFIHNINHEIQHIVHHYDNIFLNNDNEKPEIQRFNKIVFPTYDEAYQHIVNVKLLPGQQYIVYYKNRDSEFNGYSSILAIGNINVSAGNILYMDKSYVDSLKKQEESFNEQSWQYILSNSIENLKAKVEELQAQLNEIQNNNTIVEP